VNIHINCVNVMLVKLVVTKCCKGCKELRLCMSDEFNIGGINIDINIMFFEKI